VDSSCDRNTARAFRVLWYWPDSQRLPVCLGEQVHLYDWFGGSSWHVALPSHGLLLHFDCDMGPGANTTWTSLTTTDKTSEIYYTTGLNFYNHAMKILSLCSQRVHCISISVNSWNLMDLAFAVLKFSAKLMLLYIKFAYIYGNC